MMTFPLLKKLWRNFNMINTRNEAVIDEVLGRFELVALDSGFILGSYSRRRDAIRGAQRRGLTVVD